MPISVIIPLYNKGATIARALQSILDQTVAAREIIVVDDESTDDSIEIVRRFGDRVTLICQKNAGPSAARNRGAQSATGGYLLFLDGDDELLPDALERHASCLAREPDVDLSLGSFQHVFPSGSSYSTILANRIDRSTADFVYLTTFSIDTVINVHSGSICISRGLFDRIGRWDEKLRCWEITDLLMRASFDSRKTCLHRQVTMTVHPSDNSQFASTRNDEEYRLRLATKIIGSLNRMEKHERARMLGQVETIAYDFWVHKKFGALRRLSIAIWKGVFGKDALHSLFCAGFLPRSFLSLMHRWRHPGMHE